VEPAPADARLRVAEAQPDEADCLAVVSPAVAAQDAAAERYALPAPDVEQACCWPCWDVAPEQRDAAAEPAGAQCYSAAELGALHYWPAGAAPARS